MDLGLHGCVAIVGGASSGMGRACARTLAEEGCNVTVFARRQELLDEAAVEIERLDSERAGWPWPATRRTKGRCGKSSTAPSNGSDDWTSS
jgi:NAD(P)-dependent dehydrogenase (short-subunit alcohol dehydrogenase family)